MQDDITPAASKIIDQLLDQIFEGANDHSAASRSAHRALLAGAVDGCSTLGTARSRLSNRRRTLEYLAVQASAERYARNDTNGTRRRANETKERHALL